MPNTSDRFAHRTNPDGTVDSICKTCFMTAATAKEAESLKQLEAKHVCDSWRLEFLTALTTRRFHI